jgi:hypothetical protein
MFLGYIFSSQAHLEELVNKDAEEKANADIEALLTELALDAKENTDKGKMQRRPGKSKKRKGHRKAGF